MTLRLRMISGFTEHREREAGLEADRESGDVVTAKSGQSKASPASPRANPRTKVDVSTIQTTIKWRAQG